MPFINTKTNTVISQTKEVAIKEKLGRAITALGKSEGWLMLNFEDECRMWFKGNNDTNMAIIEVSLYGTATDAGYDKMTAEITEIISKELDIAPSNIYVKYQEIEHWGWNGSNF